MICMRVTILWAAQQLLQPYCTCTKYSRMLFIRRLTLAPYRFFRTLYVSKENSMSCGRFFAFFFYVFYLRFLFVCVRIASKYLLVDSSPVRWFQGGACLLSPPRPSYLCFWGHEQVTTRFYVIIRVYWSRLTFVSFFFFFPDCCRCGVCCVPPSNGQMAN